MEICANIWLKLTRITNKQGSTVPPGMVYLFSTFVQVSVTV